MEREEQADAAAPPLVSELPTEVWENIFSYLDSTSLLRCHRVCKQWNAVCLPGLRSFTLPKSLAKHVDDDSFAKLLSHMPNLRELRVAGASLLKHSLEEVARLCPELRSLSLEALSPNFLKPPLALSKQLTSLGLRGRWWFKQAEEVTSFFSSFAELQHLDLSRCTQLWDHHLVALAKALKDHSPQLRSVNLQGCYRIGDEGVKALSLHCPSLQSVQLKGLKNVSDVSLLSLAVNNTSLEALNIWGCEGVTTNGLTAILQSCSKLRELVLKFISTSPDFLHPFTALIDGTSPSAFACTQLTYLDLQGLVVNDDLLDTISRACPLLRNIDLRDCSLLTATGVAALVNHCPRLHSLYLRSENINDECLQVIQEAKRRQRSSSSLGFYRLDLHCCGAVTLEGLSCLEGIPIQLLNIQGTAVVGVEQLQRLQRVFPDTFIQVTF
ncbi:Lysine-specific demethylase 2A [Balamuthia mandrillaris]